VLDGSVVSWNFKPIDETWPFVLITSPSDHRLITDLTAIDQVKSGLIRVRAKAFGASLLPQGRSPLPSILVGSKLDRDN
jgi:hypothetical protein